MSENNKELPEIDSRATANIPSAAATAADPDFGAAYRRARARVLEAGALGLCRLRVA